jgi:tRNA pseudouridine55 synthase
VDAVDGILLIDKPREWTSFDVVAKIRGLLKTQTGKKIKVGHTGTLDPLATGLMIVVVGSYCKRAQEFSKLDKTYEVTMKLGETSTTGDEEGQKTQVSTHTPTEMQIKDTVAQFVGAIEQVPPAFSAIKIDGKRAYKLAREGIEPKLEPRTVTIYEIVMQKYDYPMVSFVANVGSGTYVRSLVRDIGDKLGTGAYLSELRRVSVGSFTISTAKLPQEITTQDIREP